MTLHLLFYHHAKCSEGGNETNVGGTRQRGLF